MNFFDAVKSHAHRDKAKYSIESNDNEIITIANSCNGATHLVTRHCDSTMLTQMINIAARSSIEKNSKNLSALYHLLLIMPTNSK